MNNKDLKELITLLHQYIFYYKEDTEHTFFMIQKILDKVDYTELKSIYGQKEIE